MGIRDLVNKFTSGELDPKFIAEVDYDGYRKAARKLRNVVCIPQGGAQKRFGLTYEHVIMDGANYVTDINKVRLIAYEHPVDQLFYLIIRPDTTNVVNFDIYLEDVFQVSVGVPGGTYNQTMIRDIRWVKDYDRIILLHPAVPPYALRRIADNNWVFEQYYFQFFPVYDFSSTDNPAFLPTPNTPYTDPSVTFIPDTVDATMLTANIAVYTSNHVGGLYFGNGGLFRITAINNAGTVATGYVLEDFADTSAIIGPLSALFERAWNDGQAIAGAPAGINRGWPSHGTFYQSRLVLGGSPALLGTAYASNSREYSNFDDSESLPNFTYGVEVGVTGNDVITDILATKSLVLLSNKGPAATSILLAEPTTPTNNFMTTQGTEGARNMNAVIIDNQVLYADRAGNTIWGMSYDIPDTGYSIANISILSTHLIRGPRWADIFDPDDVDGRYYLLVNTDGSLAMYNTIASENIKAWTLAQTTGAFIDVACTSNEAKFLMRRKVIAGNPAGQIDAVYTVDNTFNAFRNITPQVYGPGNIFTFVNDGDYLLFGSEIEFTMLNFDFIAPAAQNLNITFEFLTKNNAGDPIWETFIPFQDTTNGMSNSGTIVWNQSDVSNWIPQTIAQTDKSYDELQTYYWMRIKRNNPTAMIFADVQTILTNTQPVIYLERADFTIYMDCQINSVSDNTGLVTGLNNLAGQNAFFFANGFPIGTFYVNLTGEATVTSPNSTIMAGLFEEPIVVPMPVIALLQNGVSVYEPVHVDYLYLDYFESLGITIQGQNIPQVIPGDFMTQATPQPDTNYYKVPTFGGWDSRYEFVISQSYPGPFVLLAVSYTLEVSP